MGRRKIRIPKFEYLKVEQLASQGMSVALIADYFGISKATLDRRISECEELQNALNRGRSKGILGVASVAYQMATSGKCPAMTMFWLKCQGNWKEKSSIHDSDEPQEIHIEFVRANRKEKE